MLKVKQFLYSKDNLGYLIYGTKQAIAIDGGAEEAILAFLEEKQLNLEYVANTHSHTDHTEGNSGLIRKTRARKLSAENLTAMENIELEGHKIKILKTPGHSYDSVCFLTTDSLISGDTLFIGIIGKCFTGNLKIYYQSITKLAELPGNITLYPGHDYVKYALEKAKKLEPGNTAAIDEFLASYTPDRVVSSIEWEKRINPCFRYNRPELKARLKEMGLAADTDFECFKSVREYL